MKAVHGRAARTGGPGVRLYASRISSGSSSTTPGTGGGTLRTAGSRTARTLTRYSMSRPTSGCSSRTLATSSVDRHDLEADLRAERRVLALEHRSRRERRARREASSRHLLDRQHLLGAERFARRNLAAAFVAGLEPLETLLEAGEHLSVAVDVAQRARARRRFEHAAALDLQLVFELRSQPATDLHLHH